MAGSVSSLTMNPNQRQRNRPHLSTVRLEHKEWDQLTPLTISVMVHPMTRANPTTITLFTQAKTISRVTMDSPIPTTTNPPNGMTTIPHSQMRLMMGRLTLQDAQAEAGRRRSKLWTPKLKDSQRMATPRRANDLPTTPSALPQHSQDSQPPPC